MIDAVLMNRFGVNLGAINEENHVMEVILMEEGILTQVTLIGEIDFRIPLYLLTITIIISMEVTYLFIVI